MRRRGRSKAIAFHTLLRNFVDDDFPAFGLGRFVYDYPIAAGNRSVRAEVGYAAAVRADGVLNADVEAPLSVCRKSVGHADSEASAAVAADHVRMCAVDRRRHGPGRDDEGLDDEGAKAMGYCHPTQCGNQKRNQSRTDGLFGRGPERTFDNPSFEQNNKCNHGDE